MTIDGTRDVVERAYDAAFAGVQTAKEHDRMMTARNATGRSVQFARPGKYINACCEDEAASAVYTAKERAMSAIESAMGKCEREMTKAPSAETVSFLATIANRDDLSKDEIAAALEHHGATHAAQKAIIAAAKRSGVYLADTRTEQEQDIAALRNLAGQVDSAFLPWRISSSSEANGWFVKMGLRGQL